MPWWEILIVTVSCVGYAPMAFITSHFLAKTFKGMYDEDLPFLIFGALFWPVIIPTVGLGVLVSKIFMAWMDYVRKVNRT